MNMQMHGGIQQPNGVTPQQQIAMQQQNPQQQNQQQLPPQAEKIDNISRIKSLILVLRESLSLTMKTAAQLLHQNNMNDVGGGSKGVDNSNTLMRPDKHLEEFYSICDQIESHLKTSIQCIQQSTSSHQNLSVPVASTRQEQIENGPISYPQYLATVRTQIAYAKDIHDTLICASQNISPSE